MQVTTSYDKTLLNNHPLTLWVHECVKSSSTLVCGWSPFHVTSRLNIIATMFELLSGEHLFYLLGAPTRPYMLCCWVPKQFRFFNQLNLVALNTPYISTSLPLTDTTQAVEHGPFSKRGNLFHGP